MGNTGHETWNELLQKIENFKAQLEALENEVKAAARAADATGQPEEAMFEEVPATAAEPAAIEIPEAVGTPAVADIPEIGEMPAVEVPEPEAADLPPAVEVSEPQTPAEAAPESRADLPQEPIDISISDADIDLPEYAPKSLTAELEGAGSKPGKTVMDSRKADRAVMDVMAEKQAWRTDRPGSEVKNIISAISLNDRVLLIKSLFKEDPLLFRDTIAAFNGLGSLDEALAHIHEHFPDWNLNSGPVYRLMMAVRRKLR